MLASLQTTVMILLWCLVFTGMGAYAYYEYLRRSPRPLPPPSWDFGPQVYPALVLALVVLVLGKRLGGVNLLFPLQMELSLWRLVAASAVPALVLWCASGIPWQLKHSLRYELGLWQEKPFVAVTKGRGCSTRSALGFIVLSKALTATATAGLPWLFGELVVVEALFNAPGLGLAAWHAARMQAGGDLVADLALILALYGASHGTAMFYHRWLGAKLVSYG